MKKIPVGTTIAHGYRFAFHDFLAILRGIWLPLAVQLGLTVYLLRHAIPLLRALENRDPAAMSLLGPLLLLYPVIIILFLAQITTVIQMALGERQQTPLIDFPFGKDMWRLMAGYVVAILAVIALVLAFAIIMALMGFALGAMGTGKTLLTLLAGIAILIGYGGAIFAIFRFMFLLAPINVAERQLGIVRAWQLSQGNFWRIFLIMLAIVIPMAVVEYGVIFAAIGLPPWPHGEGPQAFQAKRMEWNIAMMQAMVDYWYFALPLIAVLMVIYLGTTCAAQVFAYRSLTEEMMSAPVAAD